MSLDPDSRPMTPLPEAGNDPGDPNQPLYDDRDRPAPPIGNPTADMDEISDNDSVLSEVDEAQFEDFDPANIEIDERPAIAVDEDNVKLLGRHKRKRDRADGGDGEGGRRKKEGKREKPKKSRKKKDADDDFSGGEELEGKRARKRKAATEGGEKRERVRRQPSPENEDNLSPEESKSMTMSYNASCLRLIIRYHQGANELLTEPWMLLSKTPISVAAGLMEL